MLIIQFLFRCCHGEPLTIHKPYQQSIRCKPVLSVSTTETVMILLDTQHTFQPLTITLTKTLFYNHWQSFWSGLTTNKFQTIKPSISSWSSPYHQNTLGNCSCPLTNWVHPPSDMQKSGDAWGQFLDCMPQDSSLRPSTEKYEKGDILIM